MQIVIALIAFLISSVYVIILDRLAFTSYALLKVLVLPIIIFLIALYRAPSESWREFTHSSDKWIFLLGGTVFIQILILSTGGLYSPFLVLIHIFMLGVSFIFSFTLALLFLLFSILVMIADATLHENLISSISQDPITIVLQTVSLLAIIPLAYIVSQQYHARDVLFSMLKKRITTTDVILKNLSEIIIVTDKQFKILSVNDAAERILQRSRSELLESDLFSMLLLRDSNGHLVTKDTFEPFENNSQEPRKFTDEFTLIQSPIAKRKVMVQVQPIKHIEENISEISFIISFVNSISKHTITLDESRAKYEAMVQSLDKKLKERNLHEERVELKLLERIENDTFVLQMLESNNLKDITAKIDVAKLCEQVVLMNQDFAEAFHVNVDFKIENFGEKEIEPYAVGTFPVKPEHLTGPFFTVSCDVKQLELVIKKLLDLSVLLSANQSEPHVNLNVDRRNENEIIVTISSNCPSLTTEDLTDMFVPYYGILANKTKLHAGSGIEGFLAKKISDLLGLRLDIKYKTEPKPNISFQVAIKKS